MLFCYIVLGCSFNGYSAVTRDYFSMQVRGPSAPRLLRSLLATSVAAMCVIGDNKKQQQNNESSK